MDHDGKTTEIDLKKLYRRRRTLGELRKSVNSANNVLGPVLQLLRPKGDDQIGMHFSCCDIQRQLSDIQEKLLSAAAGSKKKLPVIDSSLEVDSFAIGATLHLQESQLCSWIQSQISRPKKSWKSGDFGHLETPLINIFEIGLNDGCRALSWQGGGTP